jgi:hypothetical protein
MIRHSSSLSRVAASDKPGAVQKTADNAIKITDGCDDPFSRVWALMLKLRAYAMCGRYREAIEYAPVVEAAAIEHGFHQRLGNVIYFRGLARLALGQGNDGAGDVREGLKI